MSLTKQVIGYGLFTISGGIHGFMQGSTASLIAGGSLGSLLCAGGVGLSRDHGWGWWMSFLVTVALLAKFAPEFQKSGDVYPAGSMSAIGLWILGALIVDSLNQKTR